MLLIVYSFSVHSLHQSESLPHFSFSPYIKLSDVCKHEYATLTIYISELSTPAHASTWNLPSPGSTVLGSIDLFSNWPETSIVAPTNLKIKCLSFSAHALWHATNSNLHISSNLQHHLKEDPSCPHAVDTQTLPTTFSSFISLSESPTHTTTSIEIVPSSHLGSSIVGTTPTFSQHLLKWGHLLTHLDSTIDNFFGDLCNLHLRTTPTLLAHCKTVTIPLWSFHDLLIPAPSSEPALKNLHGALFH